MRTQKKRSHRSLLILFIIAELCFASAASCVILYISGEHIAQRRCERISSTLESFDTKPIKKNMKKYVRKASEQISETRDEKAWTVQSVNYRYGPGESYDTAGSLSMYASVHRIGVTYNNWSMIDFENDDKDYYVYSDFLSTDPPMITASGAKGDYQRYALSLMSKYGWEDTEMYALIQLWNRESGWNPNSHNKSSGAHGIPQALPGRKMASEGSDWATNGNTQIRWGLNYIRNRYGSPSNAWAHFQRSGWY